MRILMDALMDTPIMPLATAVWLVDNTPLTFQQIADFCGLHVLEVQAIADGQSAIGIKGADPITLGQLTPEELDRCIKDPLAKIVRSVAHSELSRSPNIKPGPKFKRQDKINAVSWVLYNYPIASDTEIGKLISTTASVVKSIRNGDYPLKNDIKPVSPIQLGICTQKDLDKLPKSTKISA